MESEAETKLTQSLEAALSSKTLDAKLSKASAALCASWTKSEEGEGGTKVWLEVSKLRDGAEFVEREPAAKEAACGQPGGGSQEVTWVLLFW